MSLTFQNISAADQEGPGTLELTNKALTWSGKADGKNRPSVVQLTPGDLEEAHWVTLAKGFQLKVVHNRGIHKFSPFREQDFANLDSYFRSHNVSITKSTPSSQGWNWGDIELSGHELQFKINGNSLFDFSLESLSNAQVLKKGEISLEFNPAEKSKREQLCEVRFYIPDSYDLGQGARGAEALHELVLSRADIDTGVGAAIATFEKMDVLAPRGRYDVELCGDFLRLVGAKERDKISYSSISKLFLLPHPSGHQSFLMLILDNPLRRGAARHPHVILQIDQEDHVELDLNLTEQELREKYSQADITLHMSGPTSDVLCRAYTALSSKMITIPGASAYKSVKGTAAGVGCTYKSARGVLYVLEKRLLFVPKPSVHLKMDDIASVEFQRLEEGAHNRSFDILIISRGEGSSKWNFTNMERPEAYSLSQYFKAKGIEIINEPGQAEEELLEDDESEGDDFRPPAGGSDDDDDDAPGGDEDDDDEEDDGDVLPSKSKSKPASSDKPSSKAASLSKPKKEASSPKKKGKKKDPNAPKGAPSAWILFQSDRRAQVKEENPGISFIEQNQKMAAMWASLPADEKLVFQEKAAAAKVVADAAKKAYASSESAQRFAASQGAKKSDGKRKGSSTTIIDDSDEEAEAKPAAKKIKATKPKASAPKKMEIVDDSGSED